jgi:hypothetical protein
MENKIVDVLWKISKNASNSFSALKNALTRVGVQAQLTAGVETLENGSLVATNNFRSLNLLKAISEFDDAYYDFRAIFSDQVKREIRNNKRIAFKEGDNIRVTRELPSSWNTGRSLAIGTLATIEKILEHSGWFIIHLRSANDEIVQIDAGMFADGLILPNMIDYMERI